MLFNMAFDISTTNFDKSMKYVIRVRNKRRKIEIVIKNTRSGIIFSELAS